MKFTNESGNTVYLSDIDAYVTYEKGKVQEISLDDAKRSKIFRSMVIGEVFTISEHGDTMFERNLLRRLDVRQNTPTEANEEVLIPGPAEELEVCMRGQFLGAGGYDKANRNLAIGLAMAGVDVALDIKGSKSCLDEIEARKVMSLMPPVTSDAICIDCGSPTFARKKRQYRYHIMFTTVESLTLPDQVSESLSIYDELWVTSHFCKDVLEKYTDKPIFVVPNPIRTGLYQKGRFEPYDFRPKLKDFVFLSVMTWNYRKGTDVLLKSYLQEFSGDDDVSLLLVSRPQTSAHKKTYDIIENDIKEAVQKYAPYNPPHIMRYSGTIPEYKMPCLYEACDAFVLLSRGEGFGLPYCEASLCGKPVIATNHSGQTMFLNKDNSALIDIDGIAEMPQGSTHVHFWDGQQFADLTTEDFNARSRKTLRDVYENYPSYVEKNQKLMDEIKEKFSMSIVAEDVKTRLEEIWRQL